MSTYAAYTSGGSLMSGQDQVHISYSADTNQYTFSAPGLVTGHLVGTKADIGSLTADGSAWQTINSTISDITDGDSTTPQTGSVRLQWMGPAHVSNTSLTYTSVGSWSAANGVAGDFVYGLPTSAGDVPVTGNATYSASITGRVSDPKDYGLGGIATLIFDFAGGTLNGYMNPLTSDGWDPQSLGVYTFKDTVFSRGSTTFSGAFAVPGSSASSAFQGRFTGPGAAELMGSFTAPYLSPNSGNWGTMVGVFAGKKGS